MNYTLTVRLAPFLLLSFLASTGCVDLRSILSGGIGTGPGIFPPLDGDPGSADGTDTGVAPTVSLRASNTSPNVGEEVRLTCIVIAGDANGITFDFRPNTGRLIVGNPAGTAGFIVSEPDVGTAFGFTCTATNAAGTSPPSNEVTIIPLG